MSTCPTPCQGPDLQSHGVTLGCHTAEIPLLEPELIMVAFCTCQTEIHRWRKMNMAFCTCSLLTLLAGFS